MTDEIIKLITELGFPIAIAVASIGMLGWVVRYILKDKVEDTLNRFDQRHDHLLKELDKIKKEMHLRFDQERDDTEKQKAWLRDIRSDQQIIVNYILKGK